MGYRPRRIAELIHAELAPLLRRVKDPRVGPLSIVHVWVSGDLSICRVTVSPLGAAAPDRRREREILEGLRSANGWLRRQIAKKLQLRHTPSLEFKLDDELDEAIQMTSLLSQMEAERAERERALEEEGGEE